MHPLSNTDFWTFVFQMSDRGYECGRHQERSEGRQGPSFFKGWLSRDVPVAIPPPMPSHDEGVHSDDDFIMRSRIILRGLKQMLFRGTF